MKTADRNPSPKKTPIPVAPVKGKTVAPPRLGDLQQKEMERRQIQKPAPSKIESKEKPASPAQEEKSKPALLSAKEPETIEPKSTSAAPQKIKRREVSTDVLPRYKYQKIRERLLHRQWIQFLILMIIAACLTGVTVIYVQKSVAKSRILKTATLALIALEGNRLEEAHELLKASLLLFRSYNPDPNDYQWNSDHVIYSTMLQVGAGFRSLGDYKSALETHFQVGKRNIHHFTVPLHQEILDRLHEDLDPLRWDEAARKEIYSHLVAMNPADWNRGAIYQVIATEIAGLNVKPMSQRYTEADIIAFGPLAGMFSRSDKNLRVQGIRYYRADREPGPIEFKLPDDLSPEARQRIYWYSTSGRECLVMGKNSDLGPVLLGLEGIVLCDLHTVESFNRQVLKDPL